MRITMKKTIAACLAALTLSLAIAAPASAHPFPHGGGWHGGGWRGGHGGYWGPGLALGVFGLAAGAIAASAYDCVGSRPIYDGHGHYMGQQAVNVC
jgi:hypothetical protein